MLGALSSQKQRLLAAAGSEAYLIQWRPRPQNYHDFEVHHIVGRLGTWDHDIAIPVEAPTVTSPVSTLASLTPFHFQPWKQSPGAQLSLLQMVPPFERCKKFWRSGILEPMGWRCNNTWRLF